MSAFPQEMLLWPNGQARLLNSENRIRGEINGVKYVVDLKGDFAVCALFEPQTGRPRRLYQPRFDAIALMAACAEVAEGRPCAARVIGLRARPDGELRIDGY